MILSFSKREGPTLDIKELLCLSKALQGKEPPLRVLRAHWFHQIRHLKNSDQSQSPEKALIFLNVLSAAESGLLTEM